MTNVTAYAVHVDGALWDDPQISAWCESIADAAAMMERAEVFFADDADFGLMEPNDGGLLTIVRAVFTPDEWETVVASGWALIYTQDALTPPQAEPQESMKDIAARWRAGNVADPDPADEWDA